MLMRNSSGFTLLELLIAVVLIGILAAIALIGYQAVITGTRESVQTARAIQYADAQNKFRTVLGKRRYGTFNELCQAGLLNASVAALDASCTQTAINGWVLVPGDEASTYLREHFFVTLVKENERSGSRGISYCIGDDGVLRKGTSSRNGCTLSSTPYQP